jgi:hypothetical protein
MVSHHSLRKIIHEINYEHNQQLAELREHLGLLAQLVQGGMGGADRGSDRPHPRTSTSEQQDDPRPHPGGTSMPDESHRGAPPGTSRGSALGANAPGGSQEAQPRTSILYIDDEDSDEELTSAKPNAAAIELPHPERLSAPESKATGRLLNHAKLYKEDKANLKAVNVRLAATVPGCHRDSSFWVPKAARPSTTAAVGGSTLTPAGKRQVPKDRDAEVKLVLDPAWRMLDQVETMLHNLRAIAEKVLQIDHQDANTLEVLLTLCENGVKRTMLVIDQRHTVLRAELAAGGDAARLKSMLTELAREAGGREDVASEDLFKRMQEAAVDEAEHRFLFGSSSSSNNNNNKGASAGQADAIHRERAFARRKRAERGPGEEWKASPGPSARRPGGQQPTVSFADASGAGRSRAAIRTPAAARTVTRAAAAADRSPSPAARRDC